ncbi:cytochrome aa3 quinol oxidase subunit II [Caldibacillus lycopersici]|uniref:Quinol oxidase subunit 2 n=1 Tax=Perspicuibacillus lycopersici TaxID=1325689 RepID=A0AAE3LNT2_9BACI|nr:cytochrome aa3 quinol oxidase subunit II [Perspicuibacillus lycopersici]MCU9615070.1 cytochrome aa3 quinol oxidase subunit II [Perspicuibacillus lycopersici]
MKKKKGLLVSAMSILLLLVLSGCETNLVVFDPKGPQARAIMDLINWSFIWIGLVLVVVVGLFVYIIWKYRARPENADYEPPDEKGNHKLEVIWTLIPIVIVILLTIPTVKTLYALEEVPEGYEDVEPLVIHVTSADWKWIFSYPEEDIETVNYVNIPVDRPVTFKLTSAGTMQSFWIPSLAGQEYTMNKMETELIVVADEEGSFFGRNTNFNGEGYAGMEFEVQAQSPADYEKWVKEAKELSPKLTEEEYKELLKPTHLGRLTYSNTHLDWVDHADHNAELYIDPELYRGHGYPGKIFTEDENENSENHENMNMDEEEHGGEHSGH